MKMGQNPGKKYPSAIRLWHWANALVICGSLLTVLLNSTFFDVRNNAAFIQDALSTSNVAVTQTQARAVAHQMEDRVWEVHIYFGYALAALLLYRLVFEYFLKRENSFFNRLNELRVLYFTKKIRSARHDLGIKLAYLIFYGVLLLMIITGLTVAFDTELGVGKSSSHTIKEIHGFCMYLILGFIVLHIGGVFLAERKDKKGIVSEMIGGGMLDD